MPKGVKGFQKGRKRTGGKVKGCKHKINRDVAGLLDRLNCNPIEGLATIANDSEIEPAIRVHAYARLARFIYPELKSIEHSGPGGQPIEIQHGQTSSVERLIDRVNRTMERTGTG